MIQFSKKILEKKKKSGFWEQEWRLDLTKKKRWNYWNGQN